jgi:hypothetical protein
MKNMKDAGDVDKQKDKRMEEQKIFPSTSSSTLSFSSCEVTTDKSSLYFQKPTNFC